LRGFAIILCSFLVFTSSAQTLGGEAAYNFLKLPPSPNLSAAGGVNVSYVISDINLHLNNPALLNKSVHSQLGFSFNSFFAGVKAYHLAGGYFHEQSKTSFGAGLFYLDYGNIPQTDIGGNEQGEFRPRDMVFQISAAKKYLEKWQYGVSAKLIHSDYGQYRSTALAFDVGLLFADTSHLFSAGILVKNMGVQLSNYTDAKDELPFELQIGITKRLAKAPLGFSITAQEAHRFTISAWDTTFNDIGSDNKPSSFSKIFDHFVLASHIYIGDNLEAIVGYNRLRRNELNIGNSGNGLNGFSMGFNARYKQIHFQYSRAYFQRATAYNQFGINVNLNSLSPSFD
jgi:hypothetical protein